MRLSGVKEGSRQCRRLRQNELNMSHMSLPHELQLQPRTGVSRGWWPLLWQLVVVGMRMLHGVFLLRVLQEWSHFALA